MTRWIKKEEDPVCPIGAEFSVAHVPVTTGIELRIFRWMPLSGEPKTPVFFVPGWVSDITGWVSVIKEIASNRPVYYLESREKCSARLSRNGLAQSDFTIQRMADDVVTVCRELDLDTQQIVFFGSSLGSTTIVEALKGKKLDAKGAFIICPNAQFRYPLWGKMLLIPPASSYHVTKWIILFYLRYFRVNSKKEPEQIKRYIRTLRSAEPVRIRFSAIALQDYEIWPDLHTIGSPVTVAYASSDTLHLEDDITRVISEIPQSTLLKCPSNHYMHHSEIVSDLEVFIKNIDLGL